MLIIVIADMVFWTLGEWITGQRWIEIGTEDPLNVKHANPFLEFAIITYDIIIEMGIFCVSFLAIAYFVKLIKPKTE